MQAYTFADFLLDAARSFGQDPASTSPDGP
jgi:hypothetical protein